MKKILLIDGSSYLYRAYHALPDLRNHNNEPSGVIYGVLNMLKKTIEEFSSDYIVCVFDAKGKTFRNDIYAEYKANEQNMQVIISTGDKDLAQLVNDNISLINTMTNEKLDINGVINKFGIPPGKIIDYLTLIGDKSDNVPGVNKVGPKTALKWLEEFGNLDGVIQNHEKITGAVGTNLKDSLNWLATGKKLITIKKDVDINLDLKEFLPKDQNKEELRKIYQRYNFNSWLKKEFQPNSAGEASKTQESITEFITTKKYSIVNTSDELELWIQKILKKGQCVIDTETDSLDFMIARLVGISLANDAGEACYIPLQHQDFSINQLPFEDTLEKIKTITQNQSIKKIGQNIKYDMHVLKNYGLSFIGEIEDTMLMSYVLDSTESHGMDKLSSKHLNHECISFESVVGKGVNKLTFDQINISDAFTYAAEDADVTLQLYNLFHKKILNDDKAKYIYYQIEIPSLKTLFEIERNGVLISEQILQNQSQEIGLKIIGLESQAFKIAGQPFNLSSPKQLREILFDKIGITSTRKTPTGIPSTSEDVLEELSNIHPLPKVILEHRSLSKLKNTYTDKLPKMVNSASGRIHTNYNQAVAITGRLASSEPNLQNIPIKTEEGRKVRKAFIAKQDALILSCDYSQIELRIMAHLSQDV